MQIDEQRGVVPPDEGLICGAEQALAGHPDFGDTGLIWLRAEARLRFALRILAERLPGVAAALDATVDKAWRTQLIRDPVVRLAAEASDAAARARGTGATR